MPPRAGAPRRPQTSINVTVMMHRLSPWDSESPEPAASVCGSGGSRRQDGSGRVCLLLQESVRGRRPRPPVMDSSYCLASGRPAGSYSHRFRLSAMKNLRKWTARKTVPGPGPGAGGEEGCGRGSGVFVKARNAHPRPGSRLPRRRARGFSHISAFSRSTCAFAHSKEEGGGRATVSRQRGL